MILSCGSLNMDLITRVAEAPAAGETVLGSDYEEQPGGKGGNQAVAAARLGVSVRMLGAVGGDGFGESLLAALRREGVETRFVRQLDGPSGAAFITVDQAGENRIVVAPGANSRL
ncbi:MAG TPA: PfkB family carbohydrate kinase, partial [Deinococcales bacterium]|nr:PfkB family carbohydrate kinase [Deinococcales bacterium]